FVDGNANKSADAGEWVANFEYTLDKAGNRIEATERFDLDDDGELADLAATDDTADLKQTFYWEYDALNRLVAEVYDLDSGFAGDNTEDYIATYGFDLASNRLSEQVDTDPSSGDISDFLTEPENTTLSFEETTAYTYDANDRLLSELKGDGGTFTNIVYEYGSSNSETTQTAKITRNGSTIGAGTYVEEVTFGYDAMGRMTSQTVDKYTGGSLDTSTTTTLAYNDSGIRVSKTVGGTTTTFLFDPMNPTGYAQVLEESEGGTLTKTFTLGHDVLTEAHHSGAGSGDPYTLLYDGHGSTRLLLNAAMQLAVNNPDATPGNSDDRAQVFNYDAYGTMLELASVVAVIGGHSRALAALAADAFTTFLYSGEHTNANGTQYLRARYYDPTSGRFNRLDPWKGSISSPMTLHKYIYTNNNPINLIDPTGLFSYNELLTTITSLTKQYTGAIRAIRKAYNTAETVIDILDAIQNVRICRHVEHRRSEMHR
ncbi:MAG: RHS repeat-associated core domain-containing protein, partial [Chloroflexota bacterium]